MPHLKIPPDAECGFRLTVTASLGAATFEMKVWGAGKWGWFHVTCRHGPPLQELVIPRQRLRKGQWRSLLNLIQQGQFWDLPEHLPPPADCVIVDGSLVVLEGQVVERYHRIARHEALEPGVARAVNFLLHASTVPHAGLYLQVVEPLPRLRDAPGPTP